jgi:hypothetical protein
MTGMVRSQSRRWWVLLLAMVALGGTAGSFTNSAQESSPQVSAAQPGRVTARRLNRSEYNNTVRDLLGVTFRPADDFPQDDSSYGFDTIGDVLSLPPLLMEKYMSVAERIVRVALHGPEVPKPTSIRYYPYRYRPSENPFLGKEGYTINSYDLSGLTMPSSFHAVHRFPIEGEYVIRMTGDGVRPAGSDPQPIGFWVDGKQLPTVGELSNQTMEGGNILVEGQTAEARVRIPAGDHWIAVSFLRQFEGLPAVYGGRHPSKTPMPAPEKPVLEPPPPDATPEQIAVYEKRRAAANRPPRLTRPDLYRVRFIEVTGPYQATTGPSAESTEKIFVCGSLRGGPPGCDRQIVANLARRAFRGKVSDERIDRLMRLVSTSRARGDSFEVGIGLAIQAMLVSPEFLFRIETGIAGPAVAEATATPLDELELASRLSYFLWSSMPDEELLRAAEQRRLRQPGVLETQVRRMLRDPKSAALVQDFGGQWLQIRALESVKPDPIRFERWDEYLRLSMRRETELFFQHIIAEDRSVLEFIDANYSFLNDRLGHHYGIPVSGPDFRKVDLTGTTRGGVLTHASVLTVSSYANRTSPVLRGKWILENILNTPPPDPPPDVPAIDEAAVGKTGTLRQQLEQHRANAACRSCHARMDPLGFSMENFNAIGAWRDRDGDFPIDATGTLPDGKTVDGPGGLKAVLAADGPRFAEALTFKLLLYALGRGLGPADRPVVQSIARKAATANYSFSGLVLGIVQSEAFQARRGDEVTP